jgi:hypothetical protein
VETIPGGCAVTNTKVPKGASFEKDTVTYFVSNGLLLINVGFNATCCGSYNTSSTIENDTININIETSQSGICNCICYYTYDFKYSGIMNRRGSPASYYFRVYIDNYLHFHGLIRY